MLINVTSATLAEFKYCFKTQVGGGGVTTLINQGIFLHARFHSKRHYFLSLDNIMNCK